MHHLSASPETNVYDYNVCMSQCMIIWPAMATNGTSSDKYTTFLFTVPGGVWLCLLFVLQL